MMTQIPDLSMRLNFLTKKMTGGMIFSTTKKANHPVC